jgi:hypothetical protein
MDTQERQKYQIISKGFLSVTDSLKTLGKKLGKEVKTKEVSKTNLWQMVIDHFANISSALTQIASSLSFNGEVLTIKGEDGKTPTQSELMEIILPLIPKITQPLDGHTPTNQELLDLIRPLIPEVKNGEKPTDKELLFLIKPLIEKESKKIALEASKLAQDALKPLIKPLPSTDEIATKLDELPKEWLSIDHIRGDFNKRVKTIIVPPYKSEIRVYDEGGNELYVDRLNFVGDGVTVTKMGDGVATVTIPGGSSVPTIYTETPTGDIDGVNAIFTVLHNITTVFSFAVNGQFLHPVEYTISGNQITFNNPIPADLAGTNFTMIYA